MHLCCQAGWQNAGGRYGRMNYLQMLVVNTTCESEGCLVMQCRACQTEWLQSSALAGGEGSQ